MSNNKSRIPNEEIAVGMLDYLDSALEESADISLNIAEMLIVDIQEKLNSEAIQKDKAMRDMFEGWLMKLHDVILAQSNRDISGQVITSLKKIINNDLKPMEEVHIPGPARKFIHGAEEAVDQDSVDSLLDDLGI